MVIIAGDNETVWKSARNIPGMCLRVAPQMTTRDILVADKIIIESAAIGKREEVLL
ncbi:MAG: 50S ribosomal protein L4 [Abditibacteriota bacterium]|nr:50S ribosomal protein L4 [Abditibacteriota bacterium]